MTKYYEATNVNRVIKHGEREIKFQKWGVFAGTVNGVYAADTKEDLDALAELVKNPKNLIDEITEDQYLNKLNLGQIRRPMSVTSRDSSGAPSVTTVDTTKLANDSRIRTDIAQKRDDVKQTIDVEVIVEKPAEVVPIQNVSEVLKTGPVDMPPQEAQKVKPAKSKAS